jgi:hypothetical protein
LPFEDRPWRKIDIEIAEKVDVVRHVRQGMGKVSWMAYGERAVENHRDVNVAVFVMVASRLAPVWQNPAYWRQIGVPQAINKIVRGQRG